MLPYGRGAGRRTAILFLAAIGFSAHSVSAFAEGWHRGGAGSGGESSLYDTLWLSPTVSLGAGYSGFGAQYGGTDKLLGGPALGAQLYFLKDNIFFGIDVQAATLLGMPNFAFLPFGGAVLGTFIPGASLKVWIGFGIEQVVMKSTVPTPEGGPFRLGVAYVLSSGNLLTLEMSYRQYSYDNGLVTTAYPFVFYTFGYTFPINLTNAKLSPGAASEPPPVNRH